MYSSTIIAAALAFTAPALAYPGMGKALAGLEARLAHAPKVTRQDESALMGDLKEGITTPTGRRIANILMGIEDAQVNGIPETRRKRQECDAETDPCCVWSAVSADLTAAFTGPTGRCNDLARAAVRVGFHDAFTFTEENGFGGADGSLLMDFGEENRSNNNGLQEVVLFLRGIQATHNVGFADLAQYAHNHATVTCPLGPQIATFVGRIDAEQAAPDNLLPSVTDSADSLIQQFADRGFTPADISALIGAHTTGRQFHTDTTNAGAPFDSTPGVWDVAFYTETTQANPDARLHILASDLALANDNRTKPSFDGFVGRQGRWNGGYSRAWQIMQFLGVQNLNDLTECTATLPSPQTTFSFAPGEFIFEK